MDHLRVMGSLLLLFTTLFVLQFAEARVLEHHFRNSALLQHNSAHLDAVPVANYRESNSNPSSNSEKSNQYVNMIAVELLQKEATPGVAGGSKAPEGIKEVAPLEDNACNLHEMLNSESIPGVGHMSVHGVEGNILSSSGNSPGVGHWQISKTKYSSSQAGTTTPINVLSSGPSPGVGNGHTNGIAGTQSELGTFNKLPSGSSPGVGNAHTSGIAGTQSELGTFNKLPSGPSPGVGNGHTSGIAGTQSELGTFNKLPSGPSPGVGHKVINGNTEVAQELESKKSAMIMNKLPSGPSSGVGHSATDGLNMMEKMSIESESVSKKKTAFTLETDSKRKSAMMMNVLPSGPSPGVGHSATNGRNTMEKNKEKDEEGMGIQTFNKLPSGSTSGVGHSYTNAHQPEKLQTASEDRKGSDQNPILEKLPGGPSPGDGNSSINKLKPSGSRKQKVEQSLEGLNRKIGCDTDRSQYFFGGSSFYGTPSPPMFGIAAGRYNEYPTSKF